MAAVVAESSPPDSKMTAVLDMRNQGRLKANHHDTTDGKKRN